VEWRKKANEEHVTTHAEVELLETVRCNVGLRTRGGLSGSENGDLNVMTLVTVAHSSDLAPCDIPRFG
jgi:hypothetical protein